MRIASIEREKYILLLFPLQLLARPKKQVVVLCWRMTKTAIVKSGEHENDKKCDP